VNHLLNDDLNDNSSDDRGKFENIVSGDGGEEGNENKRWIVQKREE
jgi:hypothetical protein